ncbi:hypothetical protein ACJQWK_11561 [Exserohilum turcicum]|uniref:AA9 family lytic polysaccharide monooxygenase n=1 Tax=Exserohilum turcicum (strain 28A) TaxID=671987 RepID=R0J1E8_EXST2|nr:carbohydrate-binding module family 1 protein [Exserohilum turcica Et28A]EOA90805.1 carbohydrate-binding module family 1 protein [Exserohilum turcica Et28A]
MFTKALLTTVLLSAVSAHQNLQQFWVNDVSPGRQVGIRMPPSNSPVTDVTSDDIVCNVGGSKGSGVKTIEAAEGDTIKVGWDNSGHPGPITHMLYGPVDDASQATGIGAGWFKIDEADYTNGKWASLLMEQDNMTHTFKLPTVLAAGEYLLRSEMLALHSAQTKDGAQFYIGCMQLKIKGTGSKGACTPQIELPGAYKADDKNIYIPNFYNGFDATDYKAPGGPLATCGGAGGAAPPASNTTAPLPSLAPARPASNSTVPSATPIVPTTFATLVLPSAGITPPVGAVPTGSAGAAKLYEQCGGQNFNGPTTCESPAKCVKQNDFYFQCVN